jgi:uncharacterized phage protein (TIGR02216 family)
MVRTAALSGIEPEAFWRLSVKEWGMLTERPAGAAPIRRSELMEMAEAWPDD